MTAELRRPPAIDAFGGGGFRIGGARFEGPVLILDDQVRPWTGALTPDGFAEVAAADPAVVEFVLLGIGASMQPPPRALREWMQGRSIGLEIMTTAEAIRLYNVLAQEGRRVALALTPV